MLAFLATLILDPLNCESPQLATTMPPITTTITNQELTQSMLNVGFSTFLVGLPNENESLTGFLPAPFWVSCVLPWVTRFNEQVFLVNKHYLDSSTPFQELVDEITTRVNDESSPFRFYAGRTEWNRFLNLIGRTGDPLAL